MKLINVILNKFKLIFSMDLRALGLMRIGIGFTLILDLIIRFSDLEAHYSDYGVLPLEGLFRYLWDYRYFSLFTIASSWQLIAILFIINIFCAVCLMIGYRTKLFSLICWLFLLSLHNRNPLINQGGDDLLRLILFIGNFLPWGYCYSLDSLKNKYLNISSYTYTSFACAAYLLQIIFMYVFSALLKSSPEWTTDYSALYYALSLDQILLPFGKFIFPYYTLLQVITFIVYYLELILPLFLLIPFFNNYIRMFFFILMLLLHTGIFLSLNVGLFPLISIMCTLGILPSFIFNKFERVKIISKLKSFFLSLSIMVSSKKNIGLPSENFIQSNLMIIYIMVIVYLNFTTIGLFSLPKENKFNWLVKSIRLDQHWAMFAPAVFKDDGWFIFLAKLGNGNSINIHENVNDHKVYFDKPDFVAGTYKNDRWRKYSEGILMIYNSHFRPFYCSFLMNKWNREHPDNKIYSLEIIYMKEISLSDYKAKKPTRELLCNCSTVKN